MGRTKHKRPPTPPPPTEIVPPPPQWPKCGTLTACRHCGFKFNYNNSTRGLCQTVCFANPEIREKYQARRTPSKRCKCGTKIRPQAKSCRECYDSKRMANALRARFRIANQRVLKKDDTDHMTETELDLLVESRYQSMLNKYPMKHEQAEPVIVPIMRMGKRRKGVGIIL